MYRSNCCASNLAMARPRHTRGGAPPCARATSQAARAAWLVARAQGGAPPLVCLGRAIAKLEAQQLERYTAVLGHGLDAEEALAEYRRTA